jgi:hypothetical protein
MDPTEPNEEKQPTAELPKSVKGSRYYYRHREAILEKRRQKRMETDPDYAARQIQMEEKKEAKRIAKEEKDRAREAKAAAKAIKEAEREARRQAKESLLGLSRST